MTPHDHHDHQGDDHDHGLHEVGGALRQEAAENRIQQHEQRAHDHHGVIGSSRTGVEKSLPQVTKQLAAYTVKKIRMNRAEIIRMTFFFSWKRLLKKSGTVMASPATTE